MMKPRILPSVLLGLALVVVFAAVRAALASVGLH